MGKLSASERMQYRGWAMDYSIRANTKRNMACGVEEVEPIGTILQDAQAIYDFMAEGASRAPGSITTIKGGKK